MKRKADRGNCKLKESESEKAFRGNGKIKGEERKKTS